MALGICIVPNSLGVSSRTLSILTQGLCEAAHYDLFVSPGGMSV